MAKIAPHDTCRWKFSQILIDHWSKTHEFKKEMYWNPALTIWSDTTFFDWVARASLLLYWLKMVIFLFMLL